MLRLYPRLKPVQMTQDTCVMGCERRVDRGKVRLLTLSDLDGRTNAAKAARAFIADLESDLGGSSLLSAAQRSLVMRAAVTLLST